MCMVPWPEVGVSQLSVRRGLVILSFFLGIERGKESTDVSPTFHWEPDPAPDPQCER